MKISVHITLYLKNDIKKKLRDFSKIHNSFFKLSNQTKIFVHTNKKIKNFKKNLFFIYHNIKKENPYRLTWKCRVLMEQQKNDFDYFIYSEDDMLFTKDNFKYWLKYKKLFNRHTYNVGFVRTEKPQNSNKLWVVDQFEKLDKYVLLDKKFFFVLKNPYYAMWIYDKYDFNKFINSKFWNLSEWRGLNSFTKLYDREKSAVGWHGLNMDRYKATLIPVNRNRVIKNSLLSHSSNKYVNALGNLHVSLDELIDKKNSYFKKENLSKITIFFKELRFIIYQLLRFNFKNFKKIFKN